uniref:Uncharacterized protein n=1 Tax=Alexandrium andersonii TaxID=327968 RepID=A0A7S2DML5_9DINO
MVDGLFPGHATAAAANLGTPSGVGNRRLERLVRVLLQHPTLDGMDATSLRVALRPALAEKDILLGDRGTGPRWSLLFPTRAWTSLSPLLSLLPAAAGGAEAAAAEAASLLLASP